MVHKFTTQKDSSFMLEITNIDYTHVIDIKVTCLVLFQHHFQQYFSYYYGRQFYWWRKLEYQEKTTNLPQVIFSS
jgi:hypothetical protein